RIPQRRRGHTQSQTGDFFNSLLASSLLVPSYLGNRYVNDARLVQCQHCKEDDGGKDGEEKDSTLFHGIVTPAPIQKIWGIGRLFTHPAGKRKRSP
ncbi:hypothetical protein, partial [Sinorhizobium medicae]